VGFYILNIKEGLGLLGPKGLPRHPKEGASLLKETQNVKGNEVKY